MSFEVLTSMPSVQPKSKVKFPRKLVKGKRGGYRGRKRNVKKWKVIVPITLPKEDADFLRTFGSTIVASTGKVKKNASEGVRKLLEFYRLHNGASPGGPPQNESVANPSPEPQA